MTSNIEIFGSPDKTSTLAIIPMAGFGTRVGSPEAKELLLHPLTGKTYLETIWTFCEDHKITPFFISRKNKQALNSVIQDISKNQTPAYLCCIDESFEWTSSVLQTAHAWHENNILLLPDTSFAPHSVIEDIQQHLTKNDFVMATFSVDNPSLWGMVAELEGEFFVAEKPSSLISPNLKAWGLLAFKKAVGRSFFAEYTKSSLDHSWTKVNGRVICIPLESFVDHTRK